MRTREGEGTREGKGRGGKDDEEEVTGDVVAYIRAAWYDQAPEAVHPEFERCRWYARVATVMNSSWIV